MAIGEIIARTILTVSYVSLLVLSAWLLFCTFTHYNGFTTWSVTDRILGWLSCLPSIVGCCCSLNHDAGCYGIVFPIIIIFAFCWNDDEGAWCLQGPTVVLNLFLHLFLLDHFGYHSLIIVCCAICSDRICES